MLTLAVSLLFPTLAGAQVSLIEFGTVSGQPGEFVEVPVFASFEYPVRQIVVTFAFDPARMEFLRFETRGTLSEGVDPLDIFYNELEPGRALGGTADDRGGPASLRIEPGEDRLIGKLAFRIRASAESGLTVVMPTESLGPAITGLELEIDGSFRYVEPDALSPGGVEVLPPAGPRPVGDLTCEQFLDRLRLSFTLTESYDEIWILRDGEQVAALAGTETAHEMALPGLGHLSYSVISSRDGDSSIPVSCELVAVSPAAPAVEHLRCETGLEWSNPVNYDGLFVFRNGELIATLPGDARSFPDPDLGDELTVYTVVGELEGFRSPEVNCLANGVWSLEIGDVQVDVNATRVVVPIFATTSLTSCGFGIHMDIDQSRFELIPDLEAAVEGTASDVGPELLIVGIGVFGVPAVGMVYDLIPPLEPEKYLPVGLRQPVFNFVFAPRGEFSDGDTFRMEFVQADFSAVNPDPEVAGRSCIEAFPDFSIGGEIRFGTGDLAPVEGLAAEIVTPEGDGGGAQDSPEKGVRLSWRNGGLYDSLRIERNGKTVAKLPGEATEFLEKEAAPGVFTYKVVGVRGDESSFPRSTFLATLTPPGAFLRADANRDGRVDIGDPITTLNFLFRGGSALPCEDAADTDDDGQLTLTDAILTLHHLFRGGVVIRSPGTRHPWFDPTPDGLTCGE